MNPRRLTSLAGALGLAWLVANVDSARGQEYMTPTKEHEELAHGEGVWDAKFSMWAQADGQPINGDAVETAKMFGKFWLVSDFEADFGDKYVGHMQLGYDPAKKKFVGTWVDTIGPFLQTMEGTYDSQKKELTMMAQGMDSMTGKPTKFKQVTRFDDADHHVFEMYAPVEGQDGKWWKTMEIKYARRK